MPPAIRESTSNTGTGNTTINTIATTQITDVIVASQHLPPGVIAATHAASPTAIATASAWTTLDTQIDASGASVRVWACRITSGAAGSKAVTIGGSYSGFGGQVITSTVVSGLHDTTYLDGLITKITDTNSSPIVIPQTTTSIAQAMLLAIVATAQTPGYGFPVGFTETIDRANPSGYCGAGVAWKLQTTPGLTGDVSVTYPGARAVGLLIPLRNSALAPTVGAGSDASIAAGATFSRTATENDNNAAITARSWTIESSPVGSGITNGTQIGTAAALSWTPVTNPVVPGNYTLRYSATNSVGPGTDDVVVTVTLPTPVVDGGADATFQNRSAFNRTGTGGYNVTSRAWTVVSGPNEVGNTIGTAAALSWIPILPGSYVIRYAATNATGTGTDDVALTVTARVFYLAGTPHADAFLSGQVRRATKLDAPSSLLIHGAATAPTFRRVRRYAGQSTTAQSYLTLTTGRLLRVTHLIKTVIANATATGEHKRLGILHGTAVGVASVPRAFMPLWFGHAVATATGTLQRVTHVGYQVAIVETFMGNSAYGLRRATKLSKTLVIHATGTGRLVALKFLNASIATANSAIHGVLHRLFIFNSVTTAQSTLNPGHLRRVTTFKSYRLNAIATFSQRAARIVHTTAMGIASSPKNIGRYAKVLRGYAAATTNAFADLIHGAKYEIAKAQSSIHGETKRVGVMREHVTAQASVKSAKLRRVPRLTSVIRVIDFDELDEYGQEITSVPIDTPEHDYVFEYDRPFYELGP